MPSAELRLAPSPKPERAAAVARAAEAAAGAPHLVPAEGGYLEAPVARLDQRFLVYRVDNGRVLSELRAAAAAKGTTTEDFAARAESAEVQALLHGLLMEKARDPDAPIHRELAKHGRQTDPLLVQADGVVVNGNRRLAAMRDLLAADPERYAGFATVSAAVLPPLSKEAVEFVEAALQMAPDLKLDYGWINRRLKLRQHAADLAPDRIVAAYRLPDADRIAVELDELKLAESFLDWIGRPGDYARLAGEESRFAALRERLAALGKDHMADLWRLIGFAMIAAADRLETPVEHYYPFAKPSPQAVVRWAIRALAEDRGLVEPQPPGENAPVDPTLAARLRPFLDDPARAETSARAAISQIDRLRADEGRLLGATRALGHMRRARDALAAVETVGAEAVTPAQRRRLRAELAALEEMVRGLEPEAAPARDDAAAGGLGARIRRLF